MHAILEVAAGATPQQKEFLTTTALRSGDCELEAGARIIIRSDGTANFVARAKSSDTNDEFNMSFMLMKADGTKIFPDVQLGWVKIPRLFHVESLKMPGRNQWYDWGTGFTFPASAFIDVRRIDLFYSC
jgi:hypothetical protein